MNIIKNWKLFNESQKTISPGRLNTLALAVEDYEAASKNMETENSDDKIEFRNEKDKAERKIKKFIKDFGIELVVMEINNHFSDNNFEELLRKIKIY